MDSLQNNDKAHGSAYELPMRLYLVDSYTLVPWSPLQKKKEKRRLWWRTVSAFSITVSKHVFKQNCLQYFIAIHAIEVVWRALVLQVCFHNLSSNFVSLQLIHLKGVEIEILPRPQL